MHGNNVFLQRTFMIKSMLLFVSVYSFDSLANPSQMLGKGHRGKRLCVKRHTVHQPLPDIQQNITPYVPQKHTALLATILMQNVTPQSLNALNDLVRALKSAGIHQVVVREKSLDNN